MQRKKHVHLIKLFLILFLIPFSQIDSVIAPATSPSHGGTAGGGGGGSTHSYGGGPTSDVVIKSGDIYIDKFTDKLEYFKSELIAVNLRIHAVAPQEGLKFSDDDIYIYEELYSTNANNTQNIVFDLVRASPNYTYDPNHGELLWHFNNLKDLIETEKLTYIIRANKSDFYHLGNTRLKSRNEIKFLSSKPEFWVRDRSPIIDNMSFPSIQIWQGDTNYVYCTVKDPDKDNFSCNLYYNGKIVPLQEKINLNDSFKFKWDLSNCDAGNYIFKIVADDNETRSETDGTMIEIRRKLFGIFSYPEEYKMPIITGVAVGLILSGLTGIIKRSSQIINGKTPGKESVEKIKKNKKK